MQLQVILLWLFCTFFALAALVVWRRTRRDGSSQALSLLQQQLSSLQDQLRTSLEGNSSQITQYLQRQSEQWQQTHSTVGTRLDHVSQTVGDRLDNAARVVGALDQRMAKVEEATKRVYEVGRDIASLQEILRAPKLRGNLGEQFLNDLLAQMLPQDAYALQYEFKSGERVDAVIRTAHGLVSVDAKFPLENFQKMLATGTPEEKSAWKKLFVGDVKRHVDAIAKKYIRPGEGTFDFALMYVPAENVYYEMIARDDAASEAQPLVSYAMHKKVVAVSPNTFYAYLNTILLGLRGLRVERFAKEIQRGISKLRDELRRFDDEFAKLGKHLGNAQTTYHDAEKRLSRMQEKFTAVADSGGAETALVAADAEPIESEEKLLVQ